MWSYLIMNNTEKKCKWVSIILHIQCSHQIFYLESSFNTHITLCSSYHLMISTTSFENFLEQKWTMISSTLDIFVHSKRVCFLAKFKMANEVQYIQILENHSSILEAPKLQTLVFCEFIKIELRSTKIKLQSKEKILWATYLVDTFIGSIHTTIGLKPFSSISCSRRL